MNNQKNCQDIANNKKPRNKTNCVCVLKTRKTLMKGCKTFLISYLKAAMSLLFFSFIGVQFLYFLIFFFFHNSTISRFYCCGSDVSWLCLALSQTVVFVVWKSADLKNSFVFIFLLLCIADYYLQDFFSLPIFLLKFLKISTKLYTFSICVLRKASKNSEQGIIFTQQANFFL